jgi:hypothetical protein
LKTPHTFALAIAFESPNIDGVLDQLMKNIRHIPKYWDISAAELAQFQQLCDFPTRYGSTLLFQLNADLEPEEARRFTELVDERAKGMDSKKFILWGGDVTTIQCAYAFGGTRDAVDAELRALRSAQTPSAPVSPTEPAPAG